MQIIRSIQNRIYELRGDSVMLDFDLAALYEVETKVLNQSVKRNTRRFPEDFYVSAFQRGIRVNTSTGAGNQLEVTNCDFKLGR